MVNGKSVIYDTSFDESVAIMPVETTLNGVQSQIMALKSAYSSQRTHLLTEMDVISNTQFAGILISAIGIATKSNAVRNTGAGAAGLSNLWGSHYNLAVQSANYALAAEALNCISTELSSVAPSFWSLAYTPEGVFTQSKVDFVLVGANNADTTAAYETLAGMYASLHSSIGRVDEKLRSLQASVTISTVSLSDIQAAASNKSAAKKDADATDTKEMYDAAAQNAQTALTKAATASQAVKNATKMLGDAQNDFNKTAAKLDEVKTKADQAQWAVSQSKSDLAALEQSQKSLHITKNTETITLEKVNQSLENAKVTLARELSLQKDALDAKQKSGQLLSRYEQELAIAEANEVNSKKEAESAAKLADFIKLGVRARAVQVPANAAACVVAMGK
ncbi:hypothetical protein BZG29_17190 [Janthinobacterium sp. LM6]|nr:hypothetical protein BZG29_17190 [Janthinobacterium sp. LM6]